MPQQVWLDLNRDSFETLAISHWFNVDLSMMSRLSITAIVETAFVIGITLRVLQMKEILIFGKAATQVNLILGLDQVVSLIWYFAMNFAFVLHMIFPWRLFDIVGHYGCQMLLILDVFSLNFIQSLNFTIALYRALVFMGKLKTDSERWASCLIGIACCSGLSSMMAFWSTTQVLGQNFAYHYCYGFSLDYMTILRDYRGSHSMLEEIMSLIYIALTLGALAMNMSFSYIVYKHDSSMAWLVTKKDLNRRHKRNAVNFVYHLYYSLSAATWVIVVGFCYEYLFYNNSSKETYSVVISICFFLEFGLWSFISFLLTTPSITNKLVQ